jgi:hypothetical protein
MRRLGTQRRRRRGMQQPSQGSRNSTCLHVRSTFSHNNGIHYSPFMPFHSIPFHSRVLIGRDNNSEYARIHSGLCSAILQHPSDALTFEHPPVPVPVLYAGRGHPPPLPPRLCRGESRPEAPICPNLPGVIGFSGSHCFSGMAAPISLSTVVHGTISPSRLTPHASRLKHMAKASGEFPKCLGAPHFHKCSLN